MKIIYWQDIKLFLSCARCFYIKHVLKITPPSMDSDFSLPNIIDKLRKEEGDFCRTFNRTLEIMEKNKIDAIPFEDHKKSIELWRTPSYNNSNGGVNYLDQSTNLFFSGALDDVFINSERELIVVEFKSNSIQSKKYLKKSFWYKINEMQVSYYSWLLKKNNHNVSKQGYLIYSSAFDKSLDFYPFNNRLYFKTSIFACNIDYNKIEETISELYVCLQKSEVPQPETYKNGVIKCKFCNYAKKIKLSSIDFLKE